MASIEDGTWAHMQAAGRWHFDPDRTEPPNAHRIVARVRAPFERMIEQVPEGRPKTLRGSMVHRPATGSYYDRIQTGNEADGVRLGLDPDEPYADVFDAKEQGARTAPLVDQLVSLLPLDDSYWKLHRQRPGQTWPIHFDNYHAFDRSDADVEQWVDPGVRRLWIMLSDWRWGQFVQLGNRVWTHWSSGDVMYFDWLVPHGSANCGHSDRVSLLVTGVPTDELHLWLAASSPRVIELG